MKQVYSSKLGTRVFALSPDQLQVFREAGYQTPTPEEAIADAGAIQLVPPEGARAIVIFNFKSGIFSVRVKTCLLGPGETADFVGELMAADVLRQMAQQAGAARTATAPAAGVYKLTPGEYTTEPAGPARDTPLIARAQPRADSPLITPAPGPETSQDVEIKQAINESMKGAVLASVSKAMENSINAIMEKAVNAAMVKAAGDIQAGAAASAGREA